MVRLDLTDIQGNILRGYNPRRGRHLFFTVTDAEEARRSLGRLADRVRNAEDWKPQYKPRFVVNVALTYRGLEALEVDDDVLRALPDEFIDPVKRRARKILCDDVSGWSEPYLSDSDKQHVLLLVNQLPPNEVQADLRAPYRKLDAAYRRDFESDDSAEVLERFVEELIPAKGLSQLGETQAVEALENQREHFGFADGFGQPAVEGAPGPKTGGQGVPPSGDSAQWRDLKAGEFIHGYPDEDGYVVSNEAAPLLRNGSFMIYRKLEQNVAAFNKILDEEAAKYRAWTGTPPNADMAREQLAAKLAGRWRDGESVELRPWRTDDPKEIAGGGMRRLSNDFRYGNDRQGLRCPIGAHVRRTNPRDDDGRDGALAKRHRIIRRSMPYGPPYVKGDREERGLIFICFNASIKRQFETVQSQWCMDGNAFGLGRDQDWLLSNGGGTEKATIQGAPPFFADASNQIVTPLGCQYLLMPGIRALRGIAAGLW
jgi:Dyp-type peroxidase family